jgi:hypothetical protein
MARRANLLDSTGNSPASVDGLQPTHHRVTSAFHSFIAGNKDGGVRTLAAGLRFSHDVGNGGSLFATLIAKDLLVNHLRAVGRGCGWSVTLLSHSSTLSRISAHRLHVNDVPSCFSTKKMLANYR